MFKIAQDLVFKTRLPIVLQEFNFPCQVFPDKLLWKYNKILAKQKPCCSANRVEEGTGWQNVRVSEQQIQCLKSDIRMVLCRNQITALKEYQNGSIWLRKLHITPWLFKEEKIPSYLHLKKKVDSKEGEGYTFN